MIKHIDILGTKYDVYFLTEEFPQKDACGLCERYSHEIFIDDSYFSSGEDLCKLPELAKNKTIRHELIHAILHEAGFDVYSEDETLVDALATLYPKMKNIFVKMEVEE